MTTPNLIPRAEFATLEVTIREAEHLASIGQIADGCRCLLAGVKQARHTELSGQPWAPELAARYSEALDRYWSQWSRRVW